MNEIRVSAATASLLGLRDWAVEVMPTTLYFMLGDECRGACAYCTQGRNFLSRVTDAVGAPFFADKGDL